MSMKEIVNRAKAADSFAYQLLGRMKSDCEYYLGYGDRNDKYLWSGNPKDQIRDMRTIYHAFPKSARPEWLTEGQIDDFEARMAA